MPVITRSALVEVPPAVAYALVADVIAYPEFVPGCDAVELLEELDGGQVVAVQVSGRGLQERFVTRNSHEPHERVTMSLQDGPFEHLRGEWRFTALGDIGCRIDLTLDFLPRGVLARLFAGLAEPLADRVVDAFVARLQGPGTQGRR